MSQVQRWTFYDPETLEAARVPVNPNTMGAPTRPRNMKWAWGTAQGQARMRGVDQVAGPPEWPFGGVLFTKAHYDLLLAWTNPPRIIHVTDHLERTFRVIIKKFDPVERLPTPRTEWRADYTMTCLLLGEVP